MSEKINYRPDTRTAEQKKRDDEQDRQVLAKVKALRPQAEQVEKAEAALNEASRRAREAVEKFHGEHPERKRSQQEAQGAMSRWTACMSARSELEQLDQANPRALGRPWLTPNEASRNAQWMQMIQGHEANVADLRGRLFVPFAP